MMLLLSHNFIPAVRPSRVNSPLSLPDRRLPRAHFVFGSLTPKFSLCFVPRHQAKEKKEHLSLLPTLTSLSSSTETLLGAEEKGDDGSEGEEKASPVLCDVHFMPCTKTCPATA